VNKGIDLWMHILSLRPEHLVARSRLALVYERLGRKPDALREYMAVASLLQNAGEVQKAIQAVNRALQVIPESPEALQALGMIKAGRMLPKPSQPRTNAFRTWLISGGKRQPRAEETSQDQ
jgi:Flp pilus assembly protein TadD